MLVVAAIAPSRNLTWFWVAVAALAIIHATHDIACDGFYLQALDTKGQALFSGSRLGAYRLAMVLGGGLVSLAGLTSWLIGFGTAGVVMLVTGIVNALVMPNPPEAHAEASRAGPRPPKLAAFLEAFRTFVTQPHAIPVLLFMLTYRLGDIMMFAMSKPLLRDLGVGTTQRGVLNTFGTLASIAGVMLGGAYVARRGLSKTLVPLLYAQNLAIPLYIAMAVWKPHFPGIMAIVLTEQFVSGLGIAGSTVFLMQRCRREFSASHFAMATSVVSLASTFSGFGSGPLNTHLGHPLFFTVAFIASIPSLILVWFVPKTPLETDAAPA